jgi:hypothetical protein
MDLFCRYLELAKCKASINSSYRENSDHVQGAVVIPAVKSNHFVGHAIDCNIIDSKNIEWSSEMLLVFAKESQKYNSQINNDVLMLINLVRRCTLIRWGGDFHPDKNGNIDTVHFDNAMNIKNPARWEEIYKELHPAT